METKMTAKKALAALAASSILACLALAPAYAQDEPADEGTTMEDPADSESDGSMDDPGSDDGDSSTDAGGSDAPQE